MAEALLRQQGGDCVRGLQRGHRAEGINPLTIRTLEAAGHRRVVGPLEVRHRIPRPAVRLRHHRVRPGAPELPGLPRRPRIAPLGLRGSGRGRGDRGGAARGLPTGLHRAGPADRDVHPDRAAWEYAQPIVIELYLLRHADAGDPMAWQGPDAARPLSGKGERQADRLGRFLAGIGFTPDAIITSPKVRAAQTAEGVADHLGVPVTIDDRLAEGVDLAALEAVLRAAGDPARPVLVGHDPDFSDLARDADRVTGADHEEGRDAADRRRAAARTGRRQSRLARPAGAPQARGLRLGIPPSRRGPRTRGGGVRSVAGC